MDDGGNALSFLSVWDANYVNAARMYRRPNGGDWDASVALGSPMNVIAWGPAFPLKAYEQPQVAVDGRGNALAIYTLRDWSITGDDRSYTSQVFVRRRDAATGSWSAPYTLENTSGAYAREARLVMEENGTAWAVWTERTYKDPNTQTADRYAVFAARLTASGWSAPEKVAGDFVWTVTSRIATDRHGNPRVLVAWNNAFTLESTLYYSARQADGTWLPVTMLAHAVPTGGHAPNFDQYNLAVDPDGHAIAMWKEYDGTRYVALARHFTPAGGWEATELLSIPELDSIFDPQLVMDAAGNALLLYQQSDGSASYMIVALRFEKGRGWVSGARISSLIAFGSDADSPRVGFDGSGNAVAIWKQIDPFLNRSVIRANTFSPGAGWSGDKMISGPLDETVWMPDLAVSRLGEAIATWWQMDSHNYIRPWSSRRPASAGF